MKVPPELQHLVREQERRDRVAEALYERDMDKLRAAGLKQPEPQLVGVDAFMARAAAQAEAEARAEERETRIVNQREIAVRRE